MSIHNKNFARLALATALSAVLAACGGDDDNDSSSTKTMKIQPTYIEALGSEYNYEGWLIVNGEAISTGTFDIENGQTVPASFKVNADDADKASTFVLTIEPEVGDDPAPSNVHIVAGNIVEGKTTAITNHPAALGTDFADAEGKFILATPTNGNATPTQGIWFLDNSTGEMTAGLTLPTLPAGWKYEGWVAGASGPVTTGTFTNPDGKDSDGAGAAKGPTGDGPNYPGQDFVDPAMDLVGKKAVISVEPDPDNSAAPFSIKPLIGDIADTDAVQTLENKSAMSLPSAVVTIK